MVVFYEDNHSYYNTKTGERLGSVTQFISEFKEPFKELEVATKYARKNGLDVDDVLAEWKQKRDDSTKMGTFVHKMFEDYINGATVEMDSEYPKCDTALEFITEYFVSGRLIPVATEIIVYGNGIAGQIDCIAKNPSGQHFILDWKTNKAIKKENTWQNLKEPFRSFDECEWNIYSLQLAIYKKLCREYDIKDCFIVHLKEEEFEIIPLNPKIEKALEPMLGLLDT